MSRVELSDMLEDVLYAERHGLLDDVVGREVQAAVLYGVVDEFVGKLIRDRVSQHKTAAAFAGPIPLPKLHKGQIILGHDRNGRKVRVPLQYLAAHCITVSGSGGGKTVKSRFLILQIAGVVKGLFLFDLRKREFRVLRALLKRIGVNLIVVPARKLRLNPLQIADGVDPRDAAQHIADLICRSLALPPVASQSLNTTLLKLYRDFGVFDGDRHFPVMAELRDAIAKNQNVHAQARQSVVNALDAVLLSIGDVLNYRIGWTTADLARRHLLFELAGVADVDKNLILNTLLVSEFSRRIAAGVSNAPMDLWICCDEAARLVTGTGDSAIADMIGLVRGAGIGLDLSIQSADVSPAVLSNSSNKFIGRCGSAKDYDTIGAAMGLTAEQKRFLTSHLTPGTFVGQVGEGSWRQPFLFTVPHMQNPSAADQSAATADHADADDVNTLGLDELLDLPTVPVSDHQHGPSILTAPSHPEHRPEPSGLSEAELRYLRAVADNPGQPSSAYPRLASIGARKAQVIRKRLIDAGYLREHSVQTSGRGRAAIVLEPLESAIQELKKNAPFEGEK